MALQSNVVQITLGVHHAGDTSQGVYQTVTETQQFVMHHDCAIDMSLDTAMCFKVYQRIPAGMAVAKITPPFCCAAGDAMHCIRAARLCATADQRNHRRRGASNGVIDAAVQH